MKTSRIRPAVLVALATLAPASAPTARAWQPTLLNEVEVRQLIERAEPADHARLSEHFTILAQRYEADAKRHESMGRAYAGNPKLAAMDSSLREHCRQISARNREAATTIRELAAHHARLAAGVPSGAPDGGQRPADASARSDDELTRLAAQAATAADHRALEEYFTALAARFEQDAKSSATYAASWRSAGSRNPNASRLADRWDRLAQQQRASASEARSAAAAHRAQATEER